MKALLLVLLLASFPALAIDAVETPMLGLEVSAGTLPPVEKRLPQQGGVVSGRVGVFDVRDRAQLVKRGGTLLAHTGQTLVPATGSLRSEFVERANVDPAIELAQLMETQRQLEANANMIRYQDQTLGRLVNEVGKIG